MIEASTADIGRRVKVTRGEGGPREGTLMAVNASYVVVRLDGHDVPVPPGTCEWIGARIAPRESPRAIAARSVFVAAGLTIEPESALIWRVEGYTYEVEAARWSSPDGRSAGINATGLVKHWRARGEVD